jgi:hypothetical protein
MRPVVKNHNIAGGNSQILAHDDPFGGLNIQLLGQLLPRQSTRWCHLTLTLWSLIALDTLRNPDIPGLIQFMEVISWRAHGKITEDEFSVLYSEWMKLEKPSETTPANRSSISSSNQPVPTKKKFLLNLPIFRVILLEKNYAENDLDLFIGILIHENNLRLLNSTISYGNKAGGAGAKGYQLEVVTRHWLELSEEIFFSLDTPGYGSLHFDEMFFFCSCILIGLQGWKSEAELESDLSLMNVTALTLQMTRDSGTNMSVDSNYNDHGGIIHLPTTGGAHHKNSKDFYKQEISLVMFKRYLITKNLGENELTALLAHVKLCIEKLARLARLSGADDLYAACQPYEHKGSVIGSPRLFQEAVLFASGHQPPSAAVASVPGAPSVSSSKSLPMILLFLLADGERYLSGKFRAIEFDIEGASFVGEMKHNVPLGSSGSFPLSPVDSSSSNPLLSVIAANEELHDNAKRLLSNYHHWSHGEVITSSSSSNRSKNHSQQQHDSYFPSNPSELLRDPSYQLILSSLLYYKRLQQILNAGLYDFAVNQYGPSPAEVGSINSLQVLCAGLFPSSQQLLVEFGLISKGYGEFQPPLPEENPDEEVEIMHLDELGEEQKANTDTHVRRSSVINTANRRQSLISQKETTNSSSNNTSSNILNNSNLQKLSSNKSNTTADGNATTSGKSKQPPNYVKPTQNFIAKTTPTMRAAELDSIDNSSTDRTSGGGGGGGIMSSETDLTKARWQPLLDSRNNQFPVSSNPLSFLPIPPSTAFASSSSNRNKMSSQEKPSSSSDPPPVKKNNVVDPSSLVLTEDESHLFAQLLLTNNVNERNEIVEKLRNKLASVPLSPDNSSMNSNSNLLNMILGSSSTVEGSPDVRQTMKESVISPLSVSPRSPPNREVSNKPRAAAVGNTNERFVFGKEGNSSDVSSSTAPSSVSSRFSVLSFFLLLCIRFRKCFNRDMILVNTLQCYVIY